MQILARFDDASQARLQRFFRKVTLFAAFAAFVSILQTHDLKMAGALLRTQCFVGSAFSILLATWLRQAHDAKTLTYWDEAAAFSGIALLSEFANRFLLPLT
jgi:hypothetical protein